MSRTSVFARWCAVAAAGCGIWTAAVAKNEEWRDTQGNSFRGEPAGIMGPLALFRLPNLTGRRVPLRQLAPGDCVRFYERVRDKAPRADDWAKATGELSQELAGHVLRLEGGKLVPAPAAGWPEPEFYILFYAFHGEGKSWQMMGYAMAQFAQMKQEHPGMVEALFFGYRHSKAEHADMAKGMNMPWLVANFYDESRLRIVSRLSPGTYGLVIVTRDGIPLFASGAANEDEVKQTLNNLIGLLDLMRPDNPRGWADRVHYYRAIQPVAYAKGRCGPMLVGDPIKATALRQRGVTHFVGKIQVGADGEVTDAEVKPGEEVTEEMAGILASALRKAVLVPAVENGRFTSGTYEYRFEAPP
jgi:hypothetical protein